MNQYDIIIIGGGPNGLFGAYQFFKNFPSKRILVLEKKKILNSVRQFPDVLWHSSMKELNFPSYLNNAINDKYNPTSSELVKYYEHFAREQQLNILEDHEVIDIRKNDSEEVTYNLAVKHHNQTLKFNSKIIIISSGIYENTRKLDIKSDYKYCSHQFDLDTQNKKLLLLGAGNSATDYIIHLLPNNKITWVIRGATWKPVNSILTNKFNEIMSLYPQNLTLHFNTSIKEMYVDRRVMLSNNMVVDQIDECNLFLGFNSRNSLFERIGLEFDHECLKLNEGYETNIKNIYAFGSIMAQWDGSAPKPTFIHNGNVPQLEKIISHVIKNEVLGVMDCKRVHPSSGFTAPMVEKSLFQRAKGRAKRALLKTT
jgi:thioredoxin reductase